MSLPDYSQWLTPERLAVEEELWEQCGYYRWYAEQVSNQLPVKGSVIEFGCGTGWVPVALGMSYRSYLGIDANPLCLELARKKHEGDSRTQFQECDIRDWPGVKLAVDVTCAFAFLKHFHLNEVERIIGKVLWCGRKSVFTIPMLKVDHDDGVEFPHVHLSDRTVERAIKNAGHTIIDRRELPNAEWVFVTRADWA